MYIREFIDFITVDKLPYKYVSRIFPPHGLGPALLTRGSFGAVRPAAARPI